MKRTVEMARSGIPVPQNAKRYASRYHGKGKSRVEPQVPLSKFAVMSDLLRRLFG
jgi:hypothetical protein